MPRKQKIKVIKVPLPETKSLDRPKNFPRLPRLYLELLQNPDKIKPGLENKEFVPTYSEKQSSGEEENITKLRVIEDKISENESKKYISPKRIDDLEQSPEASPVKKRGSDDLNDRLKELLSESDGDNKSDKKYREKYKSRYRKEDKAPEQSFHTKTLSEIEESEERLKKKSDEFKRTLENEEGYIPKNDEFVKKKDEPPSLSELEARGEITKKKEFRNISYEKEGTDEDKRELLIKFKILKKAYPESDIPEFTIHSDYNTMLRKYEDTVRMLSLDSNVEKYKKYLIMGFMGVEFVFGKFLKFDMNGFTQQQVLSMNGYEKLLIELGEKTYTPGQNQWPVEIRLFIMVIINAAIFILGKIMTKKLGSDLQNIVSSMNIHKEPTSNSNSQEQPARRRKMKAPNLRPEDIPDIGELENKKDEDAIN